MSTLVADIETDGLLPTLTRVWQLSVVDADTGDLDSYNDHNANPIEEGISRLLRADRVIFHHGIGFDVPAIRKVYGDDAATFDNVADTLLLSRMGKPDRPGGHSLAAWGETLGHAKVEHDDWTQWSPAMENRCNEDAQITLKVWDRLKGMFDVMGPAVTMEHLVAIEIAKAHKRGFGLDVDYCQDLVSELLDENEKVRDSLIAMFPPILVPKRASQPVKELKNVNRGHALHGQLDPGSPYCPVEVQEFNPGSRVQIAQRLVRRHNWRPRSFTPTGIPEVSEDVLRDLSYPEAAVLADYLEIEKKISQLQNPIKADGRGGGWLHHAVRHADGTHRVHASINTIGTATSRPSCASPNVQQADTDPRMRRAWVPGPGKVLVGVDAKGLELRCLAHYLARTDGGAYGRMLIDGDKSDATDCHSLTQRLVGLYSRDNAKTLMYAWLYGSGDKNLGAIITRDAVEAGKPINYAHLGITLKGKKVPALGTLGKAARSALQNGVGGLGKFAEGVKRQAKYTGKLKALDGRTLWIRSPHSALNFLLQSAGIIVMKQAIATATPALEAMGLVEDVDFALVMWVHDEVQYEAAPEHADMVGDILAAQIVNAGPTLGFRCPLAGSKDIGASWAETH